jgi:glutamyl endopeptidase
MSAKLDNETAHTPISNEPDEADAIKPAAEEPSTPQGTASEPTGGVEDVARPTSVEAMPTPWTAAVLEGLRDIGEASFGDQSDRARRVLETVHGPDDRVQITNTGQFPWGMHASLGITAADGSSWIGTGWFIGPHTLATAGHVVYIKNSGVPGRDGWVRSITVMPGRNGAQLPYGHVTSTNFRTVLGWSDSGDENYDYGAIIIPTDLGNTVGWFGFSVASDADLLASTVNISGYPGDKQAGTQWYDSHSVASVGPSKVHYDVDTFGGQSGSAVYRIVGGKRYGVAVHAYGGATTNSGTRISSSVFGNLQAWKA